jgi:HrpA-like RNA helicase
MTYNEAQQNISEINTKKNCVQIDGTVGTRVSTTSSSSSQSQITSMRLKDAERLPIDMHKDRIKRHFLRHRITCIQGDTGCVKSTRVPVYLKELYDCGAMHTSSARYPVGG